MNVKVKDERQRKTTTEGVWIQSSRFWQFFSNAKMCKKVKENGQTLVFKHPRDPTRRKLREKNIRNTKHNAMRMGK